MILELYAHINTCPISLSGFTPVDHNSQIQKSVSDWNIFNVTMTLPAAHHGEVCKASSSVDCEIFPQPYFTPL